MKIDDELRKWLATRFGRNPKDDIGADENATDVTGMFADADQQMRFFTGRLSVIQWEIDRENGWPAS